MVVGAKVEEGDEAEAEAEAEVVEEEEEEVQEEVEETRYEYITICNIIKCINI